MIFPDGNKSHCFHNSNIVSFLEQQMLTHCVMLVFVCGTTVIITISPARNLRVTNPSSSPRSGRQNARGPC